MPGALIHSVADATQHRDRDDLDQAIAALVRDYFQATRVRLHSLVEEHGKRFAVCRVALEGEPGVALVLAKLEVVDLASDSVLQACVEQRRKTVACTSERSTRTVLPIESELGVVGLLELHTPQTLGSREQLLVTGLLRILKNHLKLLDYGERDTLTGLLNRKTFEPVYEKLRRGERARPAALSQSCWLGIIDIDRFKSINDSFGHLFGDEVLLLVAQLMQDTFRGSDRLFRFGGEEFVVLLEGASVDGAQIAFERLRTRVESQRFPQVGQVTISLGYTRMDVLDASANCIERADAALYYAKQHGRNQVQSHEVLQSRGELQTKVSQSDVELF